MSGSKLPRVTVLLATVLAVAVNAAANIVPFNGYNTGQLSAMYPTGFTPSGWAFGIWSLIYVGLFALGLVALLGPARAQSRVATIAPLYLVTAAGNAGWMFAWHWRLVGLSVVLMLAILVALIAITWKLRRLATPTRLEYWSVDAPLNLYFGWITAATLVNVGAWFYARQDWPFDLTMEQWALASVVAATAIYVWTCALTRDLVYGAVFLWVAVAIATRPAGISDAVQAVAAAGGAALVLSLVANTALRRRA